MIYYFLPDRRPTSLLRPTAEMVLDFYNLFYSIIDVLFSFPSVYTFFFLLFPIFHIHNGSQSTPAPLPPPLISPTTRRHSFRPLCPASTHTQLSLLFPPRPPPSIPMPVMFLHSPSAFKPLPPLYALPLLPHLQLWITSRSI